MTTIVSFIPTDASMLPSLQRAENDPAVCILPFLNHYLVRNKAATYFFRVVGDFMIGRA